MSITVTRDVSAPMKHVIAIRGHQITVDEPEANGGQDAGPDPHDLYDAALGACKALTVVWYANRKGIPLRAVEVVVERDQTREKLGVYGLTATLSLGGELTEAQRQTLLAVAAKCPIHRLMSELSTEIHTALAPSTEGSQP